jgi:hypothetical protein
MSERSMMFKIRRVLGDMGEIFNAQMGGDDQTTQFELPASIVSNVTVTFRSAGIGTQITTLTPTTFEALGDFSVDEYNGYLVLTNPLPSGIVMNVQGVQYETWADHDIFDYLQEAFLMHTQRRNPPLYLEPVVGAAPPTLLMPEIEERPLALLAASLAYEDLATAAARDITIDTGDGTVIPRSQRYQQLVAESAALKQKYRDIVELLGIQTFDTIQMMTLRRVSPQTNRLVPVYVDREWDDRRFPQRVMPPIDIPLGTAGMVVTDRGMYSAAATYYLNDTVFEGGQEYIMVSTQPVMGVDPAADVGSGWAGEAWEKTTINSGMYGYTGWAG